MPRTSHDVIADPGILWLRLGESDEVHVCHSKIKFGNQADNCHHLRFRHSAGPDLDRFHRCMQIGQIPWKQV